MFLADHPFADRSNSTSNTLGTDNPWANQIVPFNACAFFVTSRPTRHYLLSIALLLLLPEFIWGNEATKPAPSYANGAPVDSNGVFTNDKGDIAHGGASVRVPFMLRRFGTYLRSDKGAPEQIQDAAAQLQANIQAGQPAVTWVGHSTTLVQIDGINFLTDPIWSKRPSPVPLLGPRRYVAPGIALEDLPVIDFVVISHNHYDHLDLPTLVALAKKNPQTVFFVPMGNGKLLRENGITEVVELDWGQTTAYKNLTVHCLPSQHWSKRTLTDTNKTLWASWAVTGGERQVYYAGDSGYFPGFTEIGRQLGPFDLVIVPIGAYAPRAMMLESHMNPEEAFDAASDLGASKALGVHFGTFDLSDEPLAEPPQRFLSTGSSATAAAPTPWIFKIGETRSF